jgi:hypothetical protein
MSHLNLEMLPEADALALLGKYRAARDATEQDAARAIVRLLGGWTLAVDVVGAYLAAVSREEVTYAGYYQSLKEGGRRGLV